MTTERLLLPRRRLHCLLLGALGGVAYASSSAAQEAATSDTGPGLRLSVRLGESQRAGKRRPVAPKVWADDGGTTLRLSASMLAGVAARPPGGRGDKGENRIVVARRAKEVDSPPDQPEAPIPFDPSSASVAQRRLPAGKPIEKKRSEAEGLPDLSAETWELAPIRWMGTTGTTANSFSSGDGAKSLNFSNALNIQANSFVVAPYVANWTAIFGLNSSNSRFDPTTGPRTTADSSSKSYGGQVNLFPVSNFPFSANISHSTAETRSEQSSQPSSTTTLGLRQQYRAGADNYSATYNQSSFSSGSITSRSSTLGGNFSTRRSFDVDHMLEGDHTFNVGLNFAPSNSDVGGQKAELFNVNASHGWTVHEDLSVHNSLTYANNSIDRFQGNLLSKTRANVLLGATTFNWKPFEEEPLSLTGGANIGQTESENDGTVVKQQNYGANLSALYRFSPNLSTTANASVAQTTSATASSTTVVTAASAAYSGDPRKLWDFTYGWGMGANASNVFASPGTSSFSISGTANHSLTRTYEVDSAQSVSVTLGQGVSQSFTKSGSGTGLTNSAGAAWRAAYGEALSVNLSASVSDSYSTGQSNNNHFTTMDLMGNAIYQLTSRSALTGNATITRSRAISGGVDPQVLNSVVVDNRQITLNGSFSLGYTHRSPFSIPNLSYNANFIWINTRTNQNLVSATPTLDPLNNQAVRSSSFQQSADYRIGRLTFRVNHAMIDQAGRKNASIFGSVFREFDGFFDGRW